MGAAGVVRGSVRGPHSSGVERCARSAGNDAADSILLYKADIAEISETNFDLVAANITSGVIIPNLKTIYSKLKAGGKLFITGILNEESEELINKLSVNNFLMKELRSKAEWSGFYCIKK